MDERFHNIALCALETGRSELKTAPLKPEGKVPAARGGPASHTLEPRVPSLADEKSEPGVRRPTRKAKKRDAKDRSCLCLPTNVGR